MYAATLGWRAKPARVRSSWLVVGAVVLHGAAGLVRDRHHAVDVRDTASADRSARSRSEMYLLVLAEQFTVLMMAM